MIAFAIALVGLVAVVSIVQALRSMRIVGGNELGVVSGASGPRGFRTLSGGRVFVVPLLQRFHKIDLTPMTIEVLVDSAIAAGIVPLNVKATVSFAIASNEIGRAHAVSRISSIAADREGLMRVASDIIEGHLRDSIASMTPEQVMKDKDVLVAKMINVCKGDLENIGLGITTMNIADVDDHRLPGVEEPDLYIALLKRVQSVAAETGARQAQAEAKAASAEQSEARRADTEVKSLANELERLKAETRVALKEAEQRMAVGVEQAAQDAKARAAGIRAEVEAEKRKIEMLESKYKAEIVTPARASRDRAILDAKAESAVLTAKAQAELEQMGAAMESLEASGADGRRAWLIDNLDLLMKPFAETLEALPAGRIAVVSGGGGERPPLSAVTPDALAMARNEMIAGALGATDVGTAGNGGALGATNRGAGPSPTKP